jgi:hypothetical protein
MNVRRIPATTLLVLTAAALATGACAAQSVTSAPSGPATSAPSASAPSGPAAPTPPLATSTPLVALANATGNDVAIEIVDESGTLRAATSGTPGDGASVKPYTVTVGNDGPTLRLTWVDGPCDAQDLLAIDETGRRFLLVQPECPGDGVVFDRVLVLGFAESIDAGDVVAILQDGLDSTGG